MTVTQDYELGIHPVTQGLWRAVMGSDWARFSYAGWERPMASVSWEDICSSGGFLEKLNAWLQGSPAGSSEGRFSLPTEAQWEYAARGGRYHAWASHLYAGSSRLEEVGWYYENSHGETQSVGRKLPNFLGLYDMSGNVCEWCQDWYTDYYSPVAQHNPEEPATGSDRVLRGGGWIFSAKSCRVSSRNSLFPWDSDTEFGFRIVRQCPEAHARV